MLTAWLDTQRCPVVYEENFGDQRCAGAEVYLTPRMLTLYNYRYKASDK